MARALVTGASSGIGKDIAKELSKRGYDLILVARNQEKLEELKSKLNTNVEIIPMDISIKEKPKIEIDNNNKANIRKRFLKQISKKIQPLSSPKNTQLKMKRSSYFELLQSKQIFQKFLCIGIDESGLETIEDMDELMLMPKITFNFPNNKSENELEL